MTSSQDRSTVLRLGTRASKLARWQADWVASRLNDLGWRVDILEIETSGDAETSASIGHIGTVGVFTKEIQRALLNREIDIAVHSLKDLPTEILPGLTLGAVPQRESPADVVVSRDGTGLHALPTGARVGTGSLRRAAQLRYIRPDLRIDSIRGNVDTRLRKLDAGEFEAIVLAEAGLRRLGLVERIGEPLSPDVMLPAVGQGALGIECRADDAITRHALAPLDHSATRASIVAERALLAELLGGCLAPIGAWARPEGEALRLDAAVLAVDGSEKLVASGTADADSAAELGGEVAARLLDQGAARLIAGARQTHGG